MPRQEKEREVLQKRQKNEISEFCKRVEQKKNDKLKETKRSAGPNSSSVVVKPSTVTSQQTVGEHKSANGHTVKSTVKKQIHSDENLKKLQQRSMQLFEYDASKKKGGGGAMGGWTSSKHNFSQLKNQPGVVPGPRAPTPSGNTSLPPLSNSQGYIPHTSSSMVFANNQNSMSNIHGNLGTQGQPHHPWPVSSENSASYWTNGADSKRWQGGLENHSWPSQPNVESNNQRVQQQMTFPDSNRQLTNTDVKSWPTNGSSSHFQTPASQQMPPSNIPPRNPGPLSTSS